MKEYICLASIICCSCLASASKIPKGFELQPLELTGGSVLKPIKWHYAEKHRSPNSLRWIISREDVSKKKGAYETGFSINLMLGFQDKIGKSPEQLANDLINQISSYGEILKKCEEHQIETMHRVCVEKIEKNESGKEYHVMYTFMWWPGMEMVAYTSAGAPSNEWKKYQKIFDIMGTVEVVNSDKVKNLKVADEYNNPVDGNTYVADEWKAYYPEKPRKKEDSRIEKIGIRLLTSQDEISKNITVDELANFIKEIEEQINLAIKGYKSDGEVLLQVVLIKSKYPTYQMSYQGNVDKGFLQKYYENLSKIKFPKINHSSVIFQIHFKINKIKA